MPIRLALMLAAVPVASLPTAPPPAATLIVYRSYAEPILFAPTLSIDDHDYGTLGQKRLLVFALSPGPHRLQVSWPQFSAQRPAALDIVAQPGGRTYVELQAAAGMNRRQGTSALIERDEVSGAQAIACCRPPH